MPAATVRLQIEAALAHRIPSALTPAPRTIRPVAATGIPAIDALLEGGLPLGAITEVVGSECSGRVSLALSFLAGMTQAGKVCAWIDVSDALDPESAAAAGVDLCRLLWVRCGVQPPLQPLTPEQPGFSLPKTYLVAPAAKKGLHGGGFGLHPRNEVKGLSDAVGGLLQPESLAPRCAEPQRRVRRQKEVFEPNMKPVVQRNQKPLSPARPWSRIEQALRVTDLLLQAGGFSAIVLDMGGIAPEHALRVPLATWFRYRAAAERTQASILLLTQHSCAKSSGELLLRLQPGDARGEEATVFTGIRHRIEVVRRRFTQEPSNVVSLRKPPQSVSTADWQSRTTWAGPR
ncbi:RecA/RadA recombinase [Silvibacterium bohemicum]|uniref:Protein RecA n=1 Tax=Silvibacterium bohemicum TaxID=1577686 RepID=A0A841JU49_9BACT|nr:recombinase RecA [Silvibacterium bohemicum]MBB6144680.1 RecA/RadA recombinase [Silvibacterium bohemicum]